MTEKILVFVPCYNCEAQIGRVIARMAHVPAGLFAEILVVDNGSTDGTLHAAAGALALLRYCPAKLVRNDDNYNLGGSHKAAFAYAAAAGFSHVVVLHGDDQGDIRDLLPILQSSTHLRYDACLGARFMSGSCLAGYSRLRTFGNLAFNLLFSAVSGSRVHDLGSGLNLFSRTVFADASITRYADDLRFNVYLLLGCIDARRRLLFFPISWRDEDQVSNVQIVSQAVRTLKIGTEYLFRRTFFRKGEHRQHLRQVYRFTEIASFLSPEDGR